MTISDALIILATIAGPVIAVQVTRYVDEVKERQGRKLWVFKTLMATRAYTVSPQHVEALNRIDLEFSAANRREKPIIEAWRAYLDLLGDASMPPETWNVRRIDLLVELLFHMGCALGYGFDKTHIKNSTYSPRVHGRIEEQREAIRQGLVDLMEGKRVLPIGVPGPPPSAAPPLAAPSLGPP